MGAAAEKPDEQATEYKRPDAAKAFEIYDKQIKPKIAAMDTLKGDLSQPYDDIKEHAHFPRQVLNFIIGLEKHEDAKRDHFLLALSEGLKHRKLFLPSDLVTRAQGVDDGPVVPSAGRQRPKLVTVPSDGTETDLAEAGEIPFDEATPEELAQQEGRKPPETEAAE